jgi:hypothetical protein
LLVSANDAHVRIIDRPCGSGKTTKMLDSFEPHKLYLVVVPLLTEVARVLDQARVPFTAPEGDHDYGTKRNSLEALLRQKKNVVTTHALFQDIAVLARAGLLDGYDIIVDEVPEVLQTVGELSRESREDVYVNGGYLTIEDDGLVVPTEKWHRDYEPLSDTLDPRIYRLATSGALYLVNQTFMLWAFPKELILAGRSFTVLTHLAQGSLLLPYLDKHGIAYVHDRDVEVDRKHRQRAAELIEVRDIPRLKGVGFSYTAQTRPDPALGSKVSGALLGLRRGDLKDVPLENVLITCAKSRWYSGGKGPNDTKTPKQGPFAKGSKLFQDVTWIPNTTRGTNEYAHANHLIYLYDQYPNPAYLSFLGRAGDRELQERYALAELVQVIYRTGVRNGEKVVVYIPSPRMRRLLEGYLEGADMCLPQPLAA